MAHSPQAPPNFSGGVVLSDLTLGVANSPYQLGSSIQVAEGVTVTIEPGVEIFATGIPDNEFMFILHGNVIARGTNSQPIVLDGNTEARFFESLISAPHDAFLDMEYAIIQNGEQFWRGSNGGYFHVRHSTFIDISYHSLVGRIDFDVLIEFNTFIRSFGFYTCHSDADVYIRYNRFESKHLSTRGKEPYDGAWVYSGCAPEGGTLVNFNSFLNVGELVVKVDQGEINARNNYWGTTSIEMIESMIYDKADDITANSVAPFEPFLDAPDSRVP